MILLTEYFTNPTTGETKPHNEAHEAAATDLLMRTEDISQEFYAETGNTPDIDPDTGTEISGKRNGSGDGGFRIKGSSTSAGRKSSHEDGLGVDKSDQANKFDDWLTTYDREDGKRNEKLEKHGLYREHPTATNTWSHLTTRRPGSGKRTFYP